MTADSNAIEIEATDITTQPIHLGPGGRAFPVENFGWTAEQLAAYDAATRGDGADGRLVMMFHMSGEWTSWEQHPAGDEVVIACTGRHIFVQEFDDGERVIELVAGSALINPAGVWHTANSVEPGWFLTITPGLDTTHRPR